EEGLKELLPGFVTVSRKGRNLCSARPSDSSARYWRRKVKRIAVFCAPSELGLLYCQDSNFRMRCWPGSAVGLGRLRASDFAVRGHFGLRVALSGVPEFGFVIR